MAKPFTRRKAKGALQLCCMRKARPALTTSTMHALEYTKYLRDSDASSPLDLIYEIDGNEADEAPEAAENT